MAPSATAEVNAVNYRMCGKVNYSTVTYGTTTKRAVNYNALICSTIKYSTANDSAVTRRVEYT